MKQSTLRRRLWFGKVYFPLALQIAVVLLILSVGLVFIDTRLQLSAEYRVVEEEESARFTQELTQLQGTIENDIAQGQMERVQQEVAARGTDTSIEGLFVLDEKNQIFAAMRLAHVGARLEYLHLFSEVPELLSIAEDARLRELGHLKMLPKGSGLIAAYPVTLGLGAHNLRPTRVGVLIGHKDLGAAKHRAASVVYSRSWRLIASVAAFLIIFALIMHLLIGRRVVELVETAQRFAAGEASMRMPIEGRDEITLISQTFNAMADRIVSSQQRLSDQLGEAHSRLDLALHGANLGTWDWNLVTGAFEVNRRWAELRGCQPMEVEPTEQFWRSTIHPEDIPIVDEAVEDYLHARVDSFQVQYRSKVGSNPWRWVLSSGKSVTPGTSGTPRRIVGIDLDVTNEIHAATALNESLRRLELAVKSVGIGFFDFNTSTNEVFYSPEFRQQLGFSDEEFGNSPEAVQSRLHPEDADRIRKKLKRFLTEPERGYTAEFRMRHRDGSYRWISSRAELLPDDSGNRVRMVGTHLDITNQKRAAEERARIEEKLQEAQKLESLGVLAGGIAHDFNNLLTGILGNASLARLDLPSDSPVIECVQQIETASLRAADLCKQMLAYSGKGRFVVQKLSLSSIVEDTLHLLNLSISKHAALKLDLASDLPPIQGDATQIRQVIMNLVINASEAIGEQGGTIRLTTGMTHVDDEYLADTKFGHELLPGEYAYLEVSDTGCGMRPETLERIFDPFFTTKFTGRGLGLAAVLGIVRGHLGALKVESEIGRGSTFKLLLPTQEGIADPISIKSVENGPWKGAGNVLVVDDEETVRKIAGRILQRLGFTPIFAENGQIAVELFHEAPEDFRVVLLDLTMPYLDGEKTFVELRRIHPEIKVLLTSGFNEQEATSRFAENGLAGFIQKPFRPETLSDKLREILETTP